MLKKMLVFRGVLSVSSHPGTSKIEAYSAVGIPVPKILLLGIWVCMYFMTLSQ